MPNHVTNHLSMSGSTQRIEEVKAFVYGGRDEQGSEICIDFNKIIEQPEELDITAGTRAETTVEDLLRKVKSNKDELRELLKQNFEVLLDLSEEEIDLTKKYINNYIKYGYIHWYKWRIKNWGTKWNAYSQHMGEEFIYFETAWSTPKPIIKRLSEIFTDVQFTVEYADEDIGSNCGRYVFENGYLSEEYVPENCDSREFACALLGIDPSELEDN